MHNTLCFSPLMKLILCGRMLAWYCSWKGQKDPTRLCIDKNGRAPRPMLRRPCSFVMFSGYFVPSQKKRVRAQLQSLTPWVSFFHVLLSQTSLMMSDASNRWMCTICSSWALLSSVFKMQYLTYTVIILGGCFLSFFFF